MLTFAASARSLSLFGFFFRGRSSWLLLGSGLLLCRSRPGRIEAEVLKGLYQVSTVYHNGHNLAKESGREGKERKQYLTDWDVFGAFRKQDLGQVSFLLHFEPN